MAGQAGLAWLALERVSMLTLGLSDRAIRALPVFWGLLTLAAAVWAGWRWLGSAGAAVLALLFSFGDHVWFFALELKQYSADTFGGLMVPSLAAWAIAVPSHDSPRLIRRTAIWWTVSGLLQWFSYGALFVAPGCGVLLIALTWRRFGRRVAIRTAALATIWLFSVGVHYYLSVRHVSGSLYLREYWAAGFPPAGAGASGMLRWVAEQFHLLAIVPGGTTYSWSFWIIAVAGLASAYTANRLCPPG